MSEFSIEPKSAEELDQLARDIHENRVFTDRHVKPEDSHLLVSVFLTLGIMKLEPERMKEFAEALPGLIYEYWDKAGSRGINGYPIFTSMKFLTQGDTEVVMEKLEVLGKEDG